MKILIVKLSSLGDLFHVLPVVHRLKVGLEAEIHWVVADAYVEMVRTCFPDVSRVIAFRRREFLPHLGSFLRELRAEDYDLVVDLHGLLKSAMITRMARGKTKIGPSFAKEGSRFLYPRLAGPRNARRHVVEQCLDVLDALHVKRGEPEFLVNFPVRRPGVPRPRVAVVPMSRRRTKTWPAPCFVETIRRIRAVKPVSVILVGGPEERELCDRMQAEIGNGVENIAGRVSLVELGGAMREADLVVANDSGPAHMAAALDVPTLTIFGSTDPARNRPYGARHRVVTANLPCQPCFSRSCHRPGIPCLEGVTPEHVAEIALEMLGSPRPRQPQPGS